MNQNSSENLICHHDGVIRQQVGEKILIDRLHMKVYIDNKEQAIPFLRLKIFNHLVINAGRIVGFQELIKACWHPSKALGVNRFAVSEHIKELRAIFGEHVVIENIHGEGYRLKCLVEPKSNEG